MKQQKNVKKNELERVPFFLQKRCKTLMSVGVLPTFCLST